MSTVFIFHGIGGYSEENWFPWLREQLELRGHWVIVPSFPHADEPTLGSWFEFFDQYEDSVTQDSIFIGHSLGGSFALHLLEKLQKPIRATFLVASVSGPTGSQFDPRMTSFTQTPHNWEQIRNVAGAVSILHTDNDPYIPLAQAEALAKNLHTTVTMIPGGGHLNASAGFTEFPQLLELISS